MEEAERKKDARNQPIKSGWRANAVCSEWELRVRGLLRRNREVMNLV